MDIVNEIWKDIPDYEGFYQVSNFGRVRSIDRVVTCFKTTKTRKGQILKPKPDKDGYLTIMIGKAEKQSCRKTVKVHALVASAFLGDRPQGHVINHIDGVKANNCPSNLEYCTAKSNTQHAYRLGLCKKGEAHQSAKLRDSEVIEIRKMAEAGMSDIAIAKLFNVRPGNIWNIKKNKTRKMI